MPRGTRKASNNSGSSSSVTEAESAQPLTCDGCTDTLTKEEALSCSICKVWLHCYCAGVPRSRFMDISSTFICIPCSLSFNNTVVTELKSEIAALKAEIVELKTALNSANKKLDATVSQQKNPTSADEAGADEWAAVVKRNAKQRRKDRGNPISRQSSSLGQPNHRSEAPAGRATSANLGKLSSKEKQAAKVRVSGARRIWGTHWSCTSKAVNSAITKLCGITPKNVKRKFVKNESGKTTKWWFVIHDTEEVLTNLENKWDQLKLQTLWELESCFMMDMSFSQSHASTKSPTTHHAENTNQPPQAANGPEATASSSADGDLSPNENSVAGRLRSTPPSSSLENEN